MWRIEERISSAREANVSNLWLIRRIESYSRESRTHREVSQAVLLQEDIQGYAQIEVSTHPDESLGATSRLREVGATVEAVGGVP